MSIHGRGGSGSGTSKSGGVVDDNDTPVADCRICQYRLNLLLGGRCSPGEACVVAESGRQIDRFFKFNPELAARYLNDVFWERRAIAVRYAPLQKLSPLINDKDEVVRRAVAYRLPPAQLGALAIDPDREVRITVADRIAVDELEQLAGDTDYLVRAYVAQRLPTGRLFRMIRDPDRQVRKIVANRLPQVSLGLMATDSEPEVRRVVASRLNPNDLGLLLEDPDWTVRLTAVERAPVEALVGMITDSDEEVRRAVTDRLEARDLSSESTR